jgi:hypothetical protein
MKKPSPCYLSSMAKILAIPLKPDPALQRDLERSAKLNKQPTVASHARNILRIFVDAEKRGGK